MTEEHTNTIDESQQEPTLVPSSDSIDETTDESPISRIKLKMKDLNIILAVLFAFALGAIYLLGVDPSLAQASAQQQAKEKKIESVLAKMGSMAEAIKANAKEKKLIEDTLNYQVTDRHIPHDLLSGNPFIFKLDWASSRIESENGSADNTNSGAGRMAVQSILASDDGGIVLINNKVVHIGDQIYGWTVKAITGESVTLQLKDQTQTLYLK